MRDILLSTSEAIGTNYPGPQNVVARSIIIGDGAGVFALPDGFANGPFNLLTCGPQSWILADLSGIAAGPPYFGSAEVKINGKAGDIGGIIFIDGQVEGSFSLVSVSIGPNGSGRLSFQYAATCEFRFTYDRTLQCQEKEIDVPADEWVTLRCSWSGRCISGGASDISIVLTTSANTYRLDFVGIPFKSSGNTFVERVGLFANSNTTTMKFDDFKLMAQESPCPVEEQCCQLYQNFVSVAAQWDVISGTWTEFGTFPAIPTGVYATDAFAKRLMNYTYPNDNIVLYHSLGADALDDTGATQTRHRIFFSYTPGDSYWLELQQPHDIYSMDFGAGEVAVIFVMRLYLFHEGTAMAWIELWMPPGPYYSLPYGVIPWMDVWVHVFDCQITFSMVNYGAYESAWWDGNKSGTGYYAGLSLCIGQNNPMNVTGQTGIGTGSEVYSQAIFYDVVPSSSFGFIPECSTDIPCGDLPGNVIPRPEDPEDPGDPTGCCSGMADLKVGDAAEITISGIAYWFGPGCADPSCDLTSAFLTALNATHSANCYMRDVDTIGFFRKLSLINPCDNCTPVDGADLTIKMWIWVKNIAGTCYVFGKIESNCGGCELRFQSAGFGLGSDCESFTAGYLSGDGNPGAYNCCIQGVGGSMGLNVL